MNDKVKLAVDMVRESRARMNTYTDEQRNELSAKAKELMTSMSKADWVESFYLLLCASQGHPKNLTEENNLRQWAEAVAEGENSYFSEGMTPKEAHDEELSYGDQSLEPK